MPATELPAPVTPRRLGSGTQIEDGPAPDTADGNLVPGNDGNVFLWVRNSAAPAATLQVFLSLNVDGVFSNETMAKLFTIPGNQQRVIGPFPTSLYGTTLRMKTSVAALLIRPVLAPAG